MDSLPKPAQNEQAKADLAELGSIVRYQNDREMARVVVEANRRDIARARLMRSLERWA